MMRRLSRLPRAIDLNVRACAGRTRTPFSTIAAAQNETPFSEKVRQRIWGTDAPPGAKDPYGGEGVIEQTFKKPQPARKEVAVDSSYEPATSWHGLDVVGDVEPPHLIHPFRAFAPTDKIDDTYTLTACLHRAVVESLVVLHAGQPLAVLKSASFSEDLTGGVQVVSTDSGFQLDFSASDASAAQVLDALQTPQTTPLELDSMETTDELLDAEQVLDEVEAQRQTATWDPAWLEISLQDPALKFAVLKRTLQLTGKSVPDAALRSVHTVQHALDHIVTAPKPKKLADILTHTDELTSLPNVKIVERRITPIDKEQSVGRWKVIEKELSNRGLPVTGHE